MKRTRIKLCGLRRVEDVEAACALGADAVGFVCHPASPRFVAPDDLAVLARALAPFVTPVLLFVDAGPAAIRRALDAVPEALLQFHGAESAAECGAYARPYLRAVTLGAGSDLLDFEGEFAAARALLVDAPTPGHGGGGVTFDWKLIPHRRSRTLPLILAGGLTSANVGAAIEQVRPDAVDVSSGIESARGIKSVRLMQEFIAAVRAADQREAFNESV